MSTLFVLALLIGTVWWVARKVRRDGVSGLMTTVLSVLGTLLAGVLRLIGEAVDKDEDDGVVAGFRNKEREIRRKHGPQYSPAAKRFTYFDEYM